SERRLLEDDVRVRATEPERADRRTAGLRATLPLPEFGVDVEGARGEVDLRVGRPEVDARRDPLVVQRQGRLDDARRARGGLQVPHVRLERADGAVLALVGVLPVRLRERRDLD